jgi:hypothetical protein
MAHAASSTNLSVENLFSFKNHVVLVTGGATGKFYPVYKYSYSLPWSQLPFAITPITTHR